MEDGHIKTVEETLNYFGTDGERGLSLDQIKRNQEKYGPNGKSKHFFLSQLMFQIPAKNPKFLVFP